jgi:hypothetical protein
MRKPFMFRFALAGAASASVPVFALIPVAVSSACVVLASAAGAAVLHLAWSDYTRRPRFRLPLARKSPIQERKDAAVFDSSAGWTYHTVSA